ncbi:MAG: MmgE/PrpD family protein, partial [Dehalococcoidia bacterium]|nr:MmgE/PrpD family protein [Dehalococcoidia bacterium]
MTPPATRTLAHWAAGVTLESMPDEVRHACRRLVLDYLGAAIAGSTTDMSATLRAILPSLAPGSQATIIQGGRVSAVGAAFANGTAAHGLELDDGYTQGSVHPSAATLPAVLALAEQGGLGPNRVLPAVAVAVEVTTRVAAAAHPATLHAGFHNTPIAGVLGAAAGCALLLGGGPEVVASALGLAGSHAGGLREYHAEGSEVKRIHAGKAARDGLTCAVLANAGVDGPHTVLEGEQGYFRAFARGEWRPSTLLDGLGSH